MWHTESRNLLVGDIVMVEDNNAIRGEWKMAKVVEVVPSKD